MKKSETSITGICRFCQREFVCFVNQELHPCSDKNCDNCLCWDCYTNHAIQDES